MIDSCESFDVLLPWDSAAPDFHDEDFSLTKILRNGTSWYESLWIYPKHDSIFFEPNVS